LQVRILQLEREAAESEKAWLGLPDLRWANRLGAAKSTAEVLATGPDGVPLLVIGQYQSGRVAALAAGDTWRWQLAGKDDPPGKYFKRFWRQLVLYLTGHEAAARGNVWITTNRQRYGLLDDASRRQNVQVLAGVTDRLGHALTDASCSLALVGPQGKIQTVSLPNRGDTYGATIEVNEVGEYEARLTASREGKALGEATTRFVVYEPDVELENPLADPKTLAEVARLSGGKAYGASEVKALLAELQARDISDRIEFERPVDLWDNRLVLVLFVAALSFEWVTRKRLGLV